MLCDEETTAKVQGNLGEHVFQSVRPSCRDPNRHHSRGGTVRLIFAGGTLESHWGNFRHHFWRTRNRGSLDLKGELPGDLLQVSRRSVIGFGDKIECSERERLQRSLGAFARMRTEDNNGQTVPACDFAEHCDSVHSRHFQIECHDMGLEFLYLS